MIDLFTAELRDVPGWRGWWFWHVTTIGGHNPAEVATSWSIPQVIDAAIDLMIRSVLESL